MSDDKFKVIREVKLGSLEGDLKRDWDRLYVDQMRLAKENEAHEAAMDAFWNALMGQFQALAEVQVHEAHYRITPEGDVILDVCRCPACQAEIHKMSVVETVEEMYKNDLIPHQAIEHIRRRARAVDTQREMRQKMLN